MSQKTGHRKGVSVPRDAQGRILPGATPNPHGAPTLAQRIGGMQAIEAIQREISPDERARVNVGLLRRAAKYAIDTDDVHIFLQCANLWLTYNLSKPPTTLINQMGMDFSELNDDAVWELLEEHLHKKAGKDNDSADA